MAAPSTAPGQPAPPGAGQNPPCFDLDDLDPGRRAGLPRGARCRLDGEAHTCMPGLTLTPDVKGDRDLCLDADGRPAQSPRCQGRFSRRYIQRTYGLLDGVQDDPPPARAVRVRAPGPLVTREERLVQTQPLVRPGPDVCAFSRVGEVTYTPPKTQQDPAAVRPRQAAPPPPPAPP